MNDIDIVIPCHELYHKLELCLKSLFNGQQRFNKVILVDDDSSTQGTLEEFFKDKYPEITYIRNKERSYYSGSVNHGLKYATSKYVIILNSDTVTETPDAFGVMIREYEQYDDVKIICAREIPQQTYGKREFTVGYAYMMEREFLKELGNLRDDGPFRHYNSDLRLYEQIFRLNYTQAVSSAIIRHNRGSSQYLVPEEFLKILDIDELLD